MEVTQGQNCDQADGPVHVHFPQDQMKQHESEIVIQVQADDQISMQLGFLQIHHHYEIKATIEDQLGEDLTSDPLENHNVKVAEIRPSEDGRGHDLLFNFHAAKEKLMQEKITIREEKTNKSINITLNARVLGKGKGTPALKTGIHCTGIDAEYDSEQSDWQGFD